LGDYVHLLVPGQVENVCVDRVTVMATDKRDVAVTSATQLRAAIADGSAFRHQGKRAGDRG